jgi:hypothetical protein
MSGNKNKNKQNKTKNRDCSVVLYVSNTSLGENNYRESDLSLLLVLSLFIKCLCVCLCSNVCFIVALITKQNKKKTLLTFNTCVYTYMYIY